MYVNTCISTRTNIFRNKKLSYAFKMHDFKIKKTNILMFTQFDVIIVCYNIICIATTCSRWAFYVCHLVHFTHKKWSYFFFSGSLAAQETVHVFTHCLEEKTSEYWYWKTKQSTEKPPVYQQIKWTNLLYIKRH